MFVIRGVFEILFQLLVLVSLYLNINIHIYIFIIFTVFATQENITKNVRKDLN